MYKYLRELAAKNLNLVVSFFFRFSEVQLTRTWLVLLGDPARRTESRPPGVSACHSLRETPNVLRQVCAGYEPRHCTLSGCEPKHITLTFHEPNHFTLTGYEPETFTRTVIYL